MDSFGYCQAWPDALKDLSRRHYRAMCRLRCLEAALDRTDPDDFDALMNQIEATQQEVYTLAVDFRKAEYVYDWGGGTLPRG